MTLCSLRTDPSEFFGLKILLSTVLLVFGVLTHAVESTTAELDLQVYKMSDLGKRMSDDAQGCLRESAAACNRYTRGVEEFNREMEVFQGQLRSVMSQNPSPAQKVEVDKVMVQFERIVLSVARLTSMLRKEGRIK